MGAGNQIKVFVFCVVGALFPSAITAQIVLPPKPEHVRQEALAKPEKTRLEATPLSSIPAKGWYFEAGLGTVIWGSESQCGCNALTADVGLHHVMNNGLLVGGNLFLTNTITSSLSPTFKIGYQAIRKENNSLGMWSASLIAGPSIGNINRGQFLRFGGEYSGYVYGGELTFQPRLGRYSQLRGFMAVGWLTSREKFTEDAWRGPTITNMKHSGFRLRFGLIL